ncbi:KGGVGR-motif variant AAA ATPase [Sorangium sp. So ce131]|uniref:KGGVGR-motif variant AAA ATPase n=1 Tax=Sorangium sp. So ce131 TaxID=3133282 RepID=UPI003F620487
MSFTEPSRRVVTFYSYKGGVGRTMALANVAYRLANTHGLNVIAVDWDLEAPGLHRFFGISPETVASSNGILDYFVAWRDAVTRNAPEPPAEVERVLDWLLPITDEQHAPKFGSLRLLLAGRLDRTYSERLAAFHWHDFYARTAGAAAVETLREKLVHEADVVLIDSRTGLTDIGGICTVQLPDAVVLLTAANLQSFEGTESVARAIARAPEKERTGRERPRVWLTVSRVPLVEESYLAERWFADNSKSFERGLHDGLWLKEDHPDGIRTHVLPHRTRWGFEEVVLREGGVVDQKDPLVLAYEQLTGTLLRWLRKEAVPNPSTLGAVPAAAPRPNSIAELQAEAAAAERRGDTLGLAMTLHELARELGNANKYEEGIRRVEQAIGIFLSRGAHPEHARALIRLGQLLVFAGHQDEGEEALAKGLAIARQVDEKVTEAAALASLAIARFGRGAEQDAASLVDQIGVIVSGMDSSDSRVAYILRNSIVASYFVDKDHAAKLVGQLIASARNPGTAEAAKIIAGELKELEDFLPSLFGESALRTGMGESGPNQPRIKESDQDASSRSRPARRRPSSSVTKRSGSRSK